MTFRVSGLLRQRRNFETLGQDVYSRCGDDDLCINKLLIEFGILPFLVRGGHKGVTLVLQPLSKAKLVLRGTEQAWLLLSMLMALYRCQLTLTAPLCPVSRLTS